MKKRFLALILIISMLSVMFMATAEDTDTTSVTVNVSVSGEYQGTNHWSEATYTFDVNDGAAADYGWLSNGEYKFMYYPATGQIKNASQATSFALEDGKDIPEYIVIPYSIEAFSTGYASYAAKTIACYAANANYAIFRWNSSADTNIVIPEGITTIPAHVFGQNSGSNKNMKFILPSTLTTISYNSFAQSSSGGIYTNFDIPAGVTSIDTGAFTNCRNTDYVLPSGVTTLKAIFTFNRNLQNVTFEGNIPSIPDNCFRQCYALHSLTFKGNLTAPTVGTSAFNGVSSLSDFTVYYPANATGFTDESFQALFPSGTKFEKLPGVPVAEDLTITGKNVVGETLSASYTYDDPMNNAESGSTAIWSRSDDADFTTNVETIKTESVSSALGSSYTLTAADAGKYIRFAVIPRHAGTELNVGDEASVVYSQRIRMPQTVPIVTLTSPGIGYKAYVNSQITLSANATCDNTNITKVEFYADSDLVATVNELPYTAVWTPEVDGDYTITAKAYNALGEYASTEGVAVKIYDLSESIEPVWASKWSYDFNDFTSTETFTSQDGLPGGFPTYLNYSSTITSAHGLFGKAEDDYCMALHSTAEGKGEPARMYMSMANMDSGNKVYYAEMDVAFSTTDETRYFFCTRTSKGTYTNFNFWNSGKIGYTDHTGNHDFVDSEGNAVSYEANKWYHIAMVLDFENVAVEYYLSYDDEDIVVKTFPKDKTTFDYTSEISTKGIRSQGQTGITYMDNMSCGQIQDSYITSVIETPTRGSYLKGNAVNFKGYAKDSRGNSIEKVEIYGNGVLIGETGNADYSISKTLDPGNYSIIAKAISSDGYVGYSDTVNITVSGIAVSNIFSDGMVLQRGRNLKISGTGINGTIVTVSLLESQESTVVSDGKWEVILPPQPANKGTILTISADGVDIVFNNVAIGEVILCTGQSNMQYSLNKFSNLISEADQDYPDIRLFKQNSSTSNTPQTNIDDGKWVTATQVQSTSFSAMGFLTGKYYYLSQNGEVPVGLIYAAHGGSAINVWVPNTAYDYDPDLRASKTSNTYYNKMIAPFTATTIGHVLWYQGCANTYFSNNYEKLLTAYIDSYREEFGDDMMDFIIVQLPVYDFERSYNATRTAVGVRDGEWNVSRYLDRVATVVSIDCGDPYNIHPGDKLPIAQRAVLALRHFTEPQNTSLVWESPSYDSYTLGEGTMTIYFKNTAEGLRTTDGQAPRGFKIAGDDGVFTDADAVLVDNTIVIDTTSVAGTPVVRYAWENVPTLNGEYTTVNLVSSEGLPVAPFRTDTGRYHLMISSDGTSSGVYNYVPMIRNITADSIIDGKSVVTVNARDYDDSITTVEVFADGVSIGFADNIPGTTLYTLDWADATAGTHSFYAIATDTAGATSVKRDPSFSSVTVTPRQYSVNITDSSLITLSGSFANGVTATAKEFSNYKLIIAAYNGNTLCNVKISDTDTVSLTPEELEDATDVKAFLFTDMESIIPVSTPATLIK